MDTKAQIKCRRQTASCPSLHIVTDAGDALISRTRSLARSYPEQGLLFWCIYVWGGMNGKKSGQGNNIRYG